MDERLRKLIINVIETHYYSTPDIHEIISLIKQNFPELIVGVSDYDLSTHIVEVSEAIDFKFLRFKKQLHDKYFENWIVLESVRTPEIIEAIALSDELGFLKEKTVKALFSFLWSNAFVSAKTGAIPKLFTEEELTSNDWQSRELYQRIHTKQEHENIDISNERRETSETTRKIDCNQTNSDAEKGENTRAPLSDLKDGLSYHIKRYRRITKNEMPFFLSKMNSFDRNMAVRVVAEMLEIEGMVPISKVTGDSEEEKLLSTDWAKPRFSKKIVGIGVILILVVLCCAYFFFFFGQVLRVTFPFLMVA